MKTILYDLNIFRVRKRFDDIKSQAGAFLILENAIELAKEKALNVYDSKKQCVWNYEEEFKNV